MGVVALGVPRCSILQTLRKTRLCVQPPCCANPKDSAVYFTLHFFFARLKAVPPSLMRITAAEFGGFSVHQALGRRCWYAFPSEAAVSSQCSRSFKGARSSFSFFSDMKSLRSISANVAVISQMNLGSFGVIGCSIARAYFQPPQRHTSQLKCQRLSFFLP